MIELFFNDVRNNVRDAEKFLKEVCLILIIIKEKYIFIENLVYNYASLILFSEIYKITKIFGRVKVTLK